MMARMAKRFRYGTQRERIHCVLDVGTWFAMGAFIFSVVAHYADAYVPADLSGNAPALVGGLLTAVGAILKSA